MGIPVEVPIAATGPIWSAHFVYALTNWLSSSLRRELGWRQAPSVPRFHKEQRPGWHVPNLETCQRRDGQVVGRCVLAGAFSPTKLVRPGFGMSPIGGQIADRLPFWGCAPWRTRYAYFVGENSPPQNSPWFVRPFQPHKFGRMRCLLGLYAIAYTLHFASAPYFPPLYTFREVSDILECTMGR
jgi:hypothetical protein